MTTTCYLTHAASNKSQSSYIPVMCCVQTGPELMTIPTRSVRHWCLPVQYSLAASGLMRCATRSCPNAQTSPETSRRSLTLLANSNSAARYQPNPDLNLTRLLSRVHVPVADHAQNGWAQPHFPPISLSGIQASPARPHPPNLRFQNPLATARPREPYPYPERMCRPDHGDGPARPKGFLPSHIGCGAVWHIYRPRPLARLRGGFRPVPSIPSMRCGLLR